VSGGVHKQSIKPFLLLVVGILSLAVMLNACGSRPKFTYTELGNLTEIVVKDVE
jgi:hypothetical protein